MKICKEVILGRRPSNYEPKFLILDLDNLESRYLCNRLKAEGIEQVDLHDNVIRVPQTSEVTSLLFEKWDWQVFYCSKSVLAMFD